MQMSRVSQLAYSNPPIPALFQCFLLNSSLFVNAVWSNLTFPRKCTKCAMPFPHFTIDFHSCASGSFSLSRSIFIHSNSPKLCKLLFVQKWWTVLFCQLLQVIIRDLTTNLLLSSSLFYHSAFLSSNATVTPIACSFSFPLQFSANVAITISHLPAKLGW